MEKLYQINLILAAILDFGPPYLPNLPTFFWQTLNLDSPHIEVEKKVGLNKSPGGGRFSVSGLGTVSKIQLILS